MAGWAFMVARRPLLHPLMSGAGWATSISVPHASQLVSISSIQGLGRPYAKRLRPTCRGHVSKAHPASLHPPSPLRIIWTHFVMHIGCDKSGPYALATAPLGKPCRSRVQKSRAHPRDSGTRQHFCQVIFYAILDLKLAHTLHRPGIIRCSKKF